MTDELNRRVAEKIGDEPIVTAYILTSTGGSSFSDKCEPHEIYAFKDYYSSRMKPPEEILPVLGYRNYAGDLNLAWGAAEKFLASKFYEINMGVYEGVFRVEMHSFGINTYRGQGTTPALAICRAIDG